ncbi:glycosyltransferase family 2 protein [Robiginitomaculum antarcticum]|uniref:glycosyltransferase family 2 protein n=1 Tax=Robiginitomaculum antarcticum TaxID=437507 RepID=UPI000366356E|nr:glycosyltransferase family 2 protein [Robiginitomaculum antarcticum]
MATPPAKKRPNTISQAVPDLSVVIPVYNEEDNVGPLAREVDAALSHINHEIVFVNDCSTDATLANLTALKKELPQLRAVSHRANAGQSRSVRTGILAAKGAVIATLDGDMQNVPADIPALYARLTSPDAPKALALIGGDRTAGRKDTWSKKLGSRIGNGIRKKLLNDDCNDTGCGLKVFKRAAFLRLPYFDHIHRYLPALMNREGYRCEFMPVNHRAREHGVSKYTNFGRLMVSFADLRGVMWLNKRARNPEGWDEA